MKIDVTKSLSVLMIAAAVGAVDAQDSELTKSESKDACDPAACIEMNRSYDDHTTGGDYPVGCSLYSLTVPAGRRLEIGIRDFTIDLDLYVDRNLSVLQYEDHGQWESNDYGTGDESITISNPDGRYYIQVCSYSVDESVESDFTLYSVFSP